MRRRRIRPLHLLAGMSCWAAGVAVASAGSITVHLPADVHVKQATATAYAGKTPASINGTIAPANVTFADARPGLAYTVQLTLEDGTVWQGVDLNWYSRVPDKPNAGPLTDDDRQQIAAVRTQILSFFNRADELFLHGNHNRAVMLVDLRRDSAFHSDKGGEIVWRPEVWYFENHHGGWEKVQQTDRDVRRERFTNAAAYHAVVDHLRWLPELGGLKLKPTDPDLAVTLPPNPGQPATRPSSNEIETQR